MNDENKLVIENDDACERVRDLLSAVLTWKNNIKTPNYFDTYVCMYVSVYLSIYLSIYLCIYVCIYVCMYACTQCYIKVKYF